MTTVSPSNSNARKVVYPALLLIVLTGVLVWACLWYAASHPSAASKAKRPVVVFRSQPHGNAIWLEENQGIPLFSAGGIITRELFRQAVIIAAHNGLGLQPRDQSLREWRDAPPLENTLEMDLRNDEVVLRGPDGGTDVLWKQAHSLTEPPTTYADLTKACEILSRQEFVQAIQTRGWSGTQAAIKADAPAPADVESLLSQMEELSQFAAAREVDSAVTSDGESEPRLGALVRAYANLGQLTRYHWSIEYAVYTARSLLYAQRMVASDPKSSGALWHRAYAFALAGLQRSAMEDIAAATQLNNANPPAWAPLLLPFCKYQTQRLNELAAKDASFKTLATYLAFLTAEHSGSQGTAMAVAQEALGTNPQCLRIIDSMCDKTGPGMLNELSETGPQIFSQTLGVQLAEMPALPKSVVDQIASAKRRGGNPAAREAICQSLISQGMPELDKVQPSWAALGRLVQETTFAHIQRKANLIAELWGVDASQYADEVRPLIQDHPFRFVIATYGLWQGRNPQTLRAAMSDTSKVLSKLTLRQLWIYTITGQLWPDSKNADALWQYIVRDMDTSFDLEELINSYKNSPANPLVARSIERLRKMSPEAPLVVAADIQERFDPTLAARWEAEHADTPAIVLALGKKYSLLKRWDDAERCLRKYISLSPDYEGYEALASVYRDQQRHAEWLATLKEYLATAPDFGLQHSIVQEEIAQDYMDHGDYKSAIPYADAAAQTGSGAGLISAADAHTGVGDFAAAERLIADEIDHYSESPFRLYAWSIHTGHGNLAGIKKSLEDYFHSRGDRLSDEDMMQWGCFQMAEHRDAAAMATFSQRMTLYPGPVSALHIAVIADRMHDDAARDSALHQMDGLPEGDTWRRRLGAAFARASQSGPTAAPDLTATESILNDASPTDRLQAWALAACFLEGRGQGTEATSYLDRCSGISGYCVDRVLIDTMLRSRGLDLTSRPTTAP